MIAPIPCRAQSLKLFNRVGTLLCVAWWMLMGSAASAQSDDRSLPDRSILDLSLEPPTLITQPGPEYSEDRLDYAMTIGIERTPKGRLWAAWVAGGDSDKGLFVLGSSDDDGQTWKTPRLVIDPPDAPTGLRRRTLVGNLWTDPSGKLWLFFDQSMGYYDGRSGDWAITCDEPDAEPPQWSAPRRIWHGATLNKPTVLKSGEWLLPISLWQRGKIGPKELKTAYPELDPMRMANVFVSSDNGATWTRRGGVSFPNHDFDEHMIVERRDGTLWMLARTTAGMMQSRSSDEGRTWSEPTIAYPHINARFFIRRLASGNLLMMRHGKMDERTPKRSHLTAWLSSDDGESWKGGLILDERSGVSYPDGFQAPDGRIYVSYDRERAKEREILLAVFTEADVEAGQIVDRNGKSRLKGLIHKARGGLPSVSAVTVEARKPVDTSGSTEQWARQAELDAQQDRTSIPYDGKSPNKLVCDTTLRQLPDGTWALFMLAGDDIEPSPGNYTGLTRSTDEGKTWTPLEAVNLGFPREGKTSGQGPTELMVLGNRATLFFSTHSQTWGRDWQSWSITSDDNCRTWSKPVPMPGRLAKFTFIRNHIVTRDGRIMIPFQHYLGPPADIPAPAAEERPWHKTLRHYVSNPRNGVLISADQGKTWTEHGDIRLTTNEVYHGWAENNIVELSDGRIAMIIRADRLGGVLYYAESKDGGLTWPEAAVQTGIPNPGSKATLYPLGGDTVALLHNPNPKHRSPLSLWISFDGLKSWPYRRVLVPESVDGPQGRLNYPDGFVSKDKKWLHFAFDDHRHRAVYYGAKLPPLE